MSIIPVFPEMTRNKRTYYYYIDLDYNSVNQTVQIKVYDKYDLLYIVMFSGVISLSVIDESMDLFECYGTAFKDGVFGDWANSFVYQISGDDLLNYSFGSLIEEMNLKANSYIYLDGDRRVVVLTEEVPKLISLGVEDKM